jgi:DNA polymerase III delta subunit
MLKPVYALVGPDLFLQLDKLAELLRQGGPDVQRIDVEGEAAQLGEVLDELRSFAMFSSAKAVVVRNADAFITRYREQLEEYINKASPGSTLVLRADSLRKDTRIYKLTIKAGQVFDCNPPKDVTSWIVQRAKSAHRLTVRPDAARVLLDLVGDDLGRLDNELAKLALQTDSPAAAVDASSIQRTVAFQREQEIYEMTNALAVGDVKEAVRRWRALTQLDTSAEFRAVTWLGIWLEDVRAFLTSPGGFKNFWRYKERFEPFKRNANALGTAGVARLIDLLAECDRRSKSGLGEAAGNVERFLLAAKPS